MDTKQKMEQALKDALRSGDSAAKTTLRLALASLKNAEIERGGELEDSSQIALIQKEIKIRQEALEDARKNNRLDLVGKAEQEVSILERYLPKQLDELELRHLVDETIQELGATKPADMGRVIKALLGKVQGRASGDLVSRVVREQLQQMG